MLARLQQLIVLAAVGLVAGGAWLAFDLGHPVWSLLAPTMLVGCYAGALALEFRWLSASYQIDSSDRPSIEQLASSWVAELLIAPRVFFWRQPFRSRKVSDLLSPEVPGQRGVLLVHGFLCNRGLWNPWMEELRVRRIPFAAVTLEPTFGSIDRYPDTIEAAVARLELATGQSPLLVGHSMGGLAIRAWLARSNNVDRVHRVVTIATPHHGTWLARHTRTRNGIEMRIGSPWLQTLSLAESSATYKRFTCFWGHCDNIVFPTRSATLPGADNRHVSQTPHVAMAYHPDVFEEVLRLSEMKAG